MVAVAVEECVGDGEIGGIEVRKAVGVADSVSVAIDWFVWVWAGK